MQESHLLLATRKCERSMFERIGSTMFMVGGTPPRMIAKQFQEICEKEGYSNVEEFAKYIAENPEKLSREILRRYYLRTEPSVRNVSSFERIYGITDRLQCSKSVLNFEQSGDYKASSISRLVPPTRRPAKKRRCKKIKSAAFIIESSDDVMICDYDSNAEIGNSTSVLKHHSPLKINALQSSKGFIALSNLTQSKQQNQREYHHSDRNLNYQMLNHSNQPCENNMKQPKCKTNLSRMDVFTKIKLQSEDVEENEIFSNANIKHEITDRIKPHNSTDQRTTKSRIEKDSQPLGILVEDSPFIDEVVSKITPSETAISCKRNTKLDDSDDVTRIQDSYSILDELMLDKQESTTEQTFQTNITSILNDVKYEDQISNDESKDRNKRNLYVSKFSSPHSILDELLNFTPSISSAKVTTSSFHQDQSDGKTKVKVMDRTYQQTSILDELMG